MRYILLVGSLLLYIILILLLSPIIRQNFPPNLPNPTIRQLANNKDIEVGNLASHRLLGEKPFSEILIQEHQFVVIDGPLHWEFEDAHLRPNRQDYDFTVADKVFEFAKEYNLPVQAHHLVWGEEKWLPNWLKNGNHSREELLNILKDHIYTVGTHYKGRVREWTVTNESFTRPLKVKGLNDFWYDKLGAEYIEKSFIWAREVDPDAILILNDFNNETYNEVSDKTYEFIKNMKSKNIPIDGIGMQMHLDGANPPKKDEVVQNMKRFADLGLKVYVTEFDVNTHDLKLIRNEKLQIQAQIYKEMLKACIESKVCDSFAYHGITDKETWYNALGIPNADPLLFDEYYNPKPAFFCCKGSIVRINYLI